MHKDLLVNQQTGGFLRVLTRVGYKKIQPDDQIVTFPEKCSSNYKDVYIKVVDAEPIPHPSPSQPHDSNAP